MNLNEIKIDIGKYLRGKIFLPYVISVSGGDEYRKLKNYLTEKLLTVNVSSFCYNDAFPNFDAMIDALINLETDAVCLGLGETVYLSGEEIFLYGLQTKTFHKKIVILCRGMKTFLRKNMEKNLRLRQLTKFIDTNENFFVVSYKPNLKVKVDAENFCELIKLLENGRDGTVKVKSNLPLKNIKCLESAYDIVKFENPAFDLPQDILNNEHWEEFLKDTSAKNTTPDNWRYFLNGKLNGFKNFYLEFVSSKSANYDEYAEKIFLALLNVDKHDKNFEKFYTERKEITRQCEQNFLPQYISAALTKGTDAIYYLTDNTDEEKFAMIQAAQGVEKIPDALNKNFPAIADYLSDYEFEFERLTNYFRRYKKIKLCGIEDENFKAEVQSLAAEKIYNLIPARQVILENYTDAKLYWLDALGVEFDGYIQSRAKKLGLSAIIKTARADLPTLTFYNKNFYENWAGKKFEKNGKLDELIHDNEFDSATYICAELSIIDEVLEEIKTSLKSGDSDKIILTSDHGSSRLAVIYRGDLWKMQSAGEHGGRCCPITVGDEKPDCATEGNNFFVMTNYDKFQGGKIFGVELHGGATLEEILIPIIEFTLNDEKVSLKKLSPKKPLPLQNFDDGFDFFN